MGLFSCVVKLTPCRSYFDLGVKLTPRAGVKLTNVGVKLTPCGSYPTTLCRVNLTPIQPLW